MSIPERARTSNLRLRRPTLYPIELRGRVREGFLVPFSRGGGMWFPRKSNLRPPLVVSVAEGASVGKGAGSLGVRRWKLEAGRWKLGSERFKHYPTKAGPGRRGRDGRMRQGSDFGFEISDLRCLNGLSVLRNRPSPPTCVSASPATSNSPSPRQRVPISDLRSPISDLPTSNSQLPASTGEGRGRGIGMPSRALRAGNHGHRAGSWR